MLHNQPHALNCVLFFLAQFGIHWRQNAKPHTLFLTSYELLVCTPSCTSSLTAIFNYTVKHFFDCISTFVTFLQYWRKWILLLYPCTRPYLKYFVIVNTSLVSLYTSLLEIFCYCEYFSCIPVHVLTWNILLLWIFLLQFSTRWNRINNNEMGGACFTCGAEQRCIEVMSGENWGGPLWKPIWEDVIKNVSLRSGMKRAVDSEQKRKQNKKKNRRQHKFSFKELFWASQDGVNMKCWH